MRRRSRYDAMEPIDEPTWLVVRDQFAQPMLIRQLPPGTDPRMVMIEAMGRSIREGFEVEELPGVMPTYFCRKGDERRQVSIERRDPETKAHLSRG